MHVAVLRCVSKNDYEWTIFNSQKLETTEMFTNNRIDKLWYTRKMEYYTTIKMNHSYIQQNVQTSQNIEEKKIQSITSFIWSSETSKTEIKFVGM